MTPEKGRPIRTRNDLILPERVTIQLTDNLGSSIELANVLFQVKAFARRKNDYHLGPYRTNSDGLVTISKWELEAEVAANQDMGLMDYAHINACSPIVEIRLLNTEEIDRAIKARTKVWKLLLGGERERWKSLEELLTVYRSANNGKLIAKSPPLSAKWNRQGAEFSYQFRTEYPASCL